MGGYGSGPYGFLGKNSKTTVEECLIIDVRKLYREGYLKPGMTGSSKWFKGDKKIATIGWRVSEDSLHLSYAVTRPNGEKKKYDYAAPITWTKCNYGGKRPWFCCPNTNCQRRIAKLYKPPQKELFLCRHCWNLTYKSCQVSGNRTEELSLKISRLYKKLGNPHKGVLTPLPEKPKNMHWDTYMEVADEIDGLKWKLLEEFKRETAELTNKLNKLSSKSL